MKRLYTPFKVNKLELKNRVIMSPMSIGHTVDGFIMDDVVEFYKRRAQGGVGLIIFANMQWDKLRYNPNHGAMLTDEKYIPSLKKLTDAIHEGGSKVFAQLMHRGRCANRASIQGEQAVAPSPIPGRFTHFEMPKELTVEEIKEFVDWQAEAAVIAKTAGFDGVEIHAAHGYLVNQFMSPHTNHRTDKYGGDFFNRMRFISEIIISIRFACGADFPVSVRMNGTDFWDDGNDEKECQHIARYLESLGVASLNISSGSYESGWSIIEPYPYQEGWKKHLAKGIKECVHIPVIAVNTVKHPAHAEAMLEEGVSDFVGVARGNLCDPEFGNKAKRGDDARVRKCIGCMNCFKQAGLGRAIECAVNPVLGRETYRGDDKLIKNGDGRTVAVIGAGPSGLQAAITLAKRGFKVVVFEKSDRIGGNMNLAAVPPCKGLIGEFIETLGIEAADLGIDIRLNTPGTVEAAKAVGAVGVVIAAGGIDIIPQVDGIDKAYTYRQVLKNEVELKGKKIAVIGGGLTGLETAEYLSDFDNEVSVIEMAPAVGTAMYRSVTDAVVGHITKNGGHIMTGTMFKAVGDGFVTLNSLATGYDTDAPFDACVIAMGVKPNDAIVAEFEAAFDKVAVVGDTVEPGNIADATHSGLNKAFVF